MTCSACSGHSGSTSCQRGACGCCEGIDFLTPVTIDNRPGLAALAYRVGTHARFKASMLAGISAKPELASLTTRRDEDLTIALADGWATVLDVLTFYQERIANEGYLRTATERRSILELARAIGYELRPGVAASTTLAFTLDTTEQAPKKVVIDAGTRAQSLPGKDELPQPFETSEAIEARGEWNELRPILTEKQFFSASPITEAELAGTGLGLAVGDALLAVHGTERQAFRVVAVEEEPPEPPSTDGRTLIELAPLDPSAANLTPDMPLGIPLSLPPDPTDPEPLTEAAVQTYFLGTFWTAEELASRAEILGWSLDELAEHLDDVEFVVPESAIELYALRVKTKPFGHNGMLWGTLPDEWRKIGQTPARPYVNSWLDVGNDVNRDSQGNLLGDGKRIYLDGEHQEILAGGYLVLREAGTEFTRAYEIEEVAEESRADYGITGKATRVELDTSTNLSVFEARTATVWGASERLALADLPIETDVHSGGLELGRLAIGLEPGRQVVVRGERKDLPGVVGAEVRLLDEVTHSLQTGHTILAFDEPLDHRYIRSTVTVSANVAPATHGESKSQVLGSGSAAEPFQRFELKSKPLTYTSAPVPSGGESTLELRVNGVAWHESPDFYRLGPGDRQYVLRHTDGGTTRVLFGDGEHGARLPTGNENVTATYRVGVGLDGHVDAGRINLLAAQPLGVRGVVNPVAATGAEDPETLAGARENAPLTVLTLDRIVSLQDYEDFARAFSGIGKARADRVWDGHRRVVHVTVTGAERQPLPDDAPVLDDLLEAMDRFRDPGQPVSLGPHVPLLFRFEATLVVHPDHLLETVLGAAEDAVEESFSFASRGLVDPVAGSDLITVLQAVDGVIAVDLDVLELTPSGGGLEHGRLLALPARLGPIDPAVPGPPPILGAELLTLAPGGAQLAGVRPGGGGS